MADRNTLLFGSVFLLATAAVAADYAAHKPQNLPPVISGTAAPMNKCGLASPCAPKAAEKPPHPCGL
ncbi:MAG: hypothetical protein EXQ89_06990 [Rhodospirillaceae bacterium]|nr:hypothetical protein [Rhodospirillaceae bacterium]